MVAASKRLTIHHSPNVLTVCLKRFDAFTGRKISKVAIQLQRTFVYSAGHIPSRRIRFGECPLSAGNKDQLVPSSKKNQCTS